MYEPNISASQLASDLEKKKKKKKKKNPPWAYKWKMAFSPNLFK